MPRGAVGSLSEVATKFRVTVRFGESVKHMRIPCNVAVSQWFDSLCGKFGEVEDVGLFTEDGYQFEEDDTLVSLGLEDGACLHVRQDICDG